MTTNNENTLDQVCSELDQLTLDYLSKINQYTLDRTSTSGEVQKGFLDLAHAKYTMGTKTISRFSYDERMKAQVQLKVDHNNNTPYTMTRLSPEILELESKTTEEAQLRQRKEDKSKQGNRDSDSEKEKDDGTKDKVEKKTAKTNGNPLHWFGFLVSSSLRTSQNHFQTAITHYIDLANLIHELEIMEQQYQYLKKKKQELMDQQLQKDTATMTATLSTAAI
ncbi:hypothetical protein BCR42DRAFT_381539 [Absidia repens]|uniref:Vacuolar ATPase assembly protein VMA22 n=1 Tax=Absidia repens TaxID=90262 RepID=A0A1X2I4T0_9FUNG|nr:hypothetical protein BCR42DRAFT_381539 [Absidia repens]